MPGPISLLPIATPPVQRDNVRIVLQHPQTEAEPIPTVLEPLNYDSLLERKSK